MDSTIKIFIKNIYFEFTTYLQLWWHLQYILFQVPEKYLNDYNHIEDSWRREYLGQYFDTIKNI